AFRVTAAGANCGLGPDRMLGVIERFARVTWLPMVAQPNAGIPVLRDGRAFYPASAEEMAEYAAKFVEAGCAVVGSCCGSTPDHTRAIAARVAGMKPLPRRKDDGVHLSARSSWVIAGAGRPFVVVGERINPTGKPGLSAELRKGSMRLLREEATGQAGRGARCLDLNVSVPDTDEVALMSSAAQAVEKVADVPVFIDSMNVAAVEQALKTLPGRCVINSVPAQKKRLGVLLPLAAQYGCAIVALAVGEAGVAESAKSRLELLQTVLREAGRFGLTEDDVLFDPTILTVSTAGAHVRETLEALRLIRERGWTSILGVSNVSFGMPQRSLLNASFLGMAMAEGLDAAFLNPHDDRVREVLLAASALVREDAAGRKFAAAFAAAAEAPERHDEAATQPGPRRPASPAEALEQALAQGEKEDAVKAAELLLKGGANVAQVIEEHLVPVMRRIGEQFEKGELFLPHVVMSAEAAQGIFKLLSSQQENPVGLRGKIVIATVEGDVHDIGKNLVAMMLRTNGFEVFDLGKGVPCEDIAAKAEEVGADIVAMSALLTTTMPRMEDVSKLLRERKLSSRVLIGGAPVNREYAARIGAAYAPNAVEAVKTAGALTR
ncbi:MAG: dihydropteroate synthase, partial [Candidatus Eisenbacteria bacterium]|nr:dihydropteroate synthase [Candidatus Eisenbacteria bacterium]